MLAAPPAWFTRALQSPAESAWVEVAGCWVRCYAWGRSGRPGVVLVHGNGAHSQWWSFIAPFLARERRIVALDLGGMGDSGVPAPYGPEALADQIAAVTAHLAGPDPVALIGHSFGGLIAVVAAQRHRARFDRLIVIDTPFMLDDHERRPRGYRSPVKKVYPDFDSALRRFRLIPEQPCDNDFIFDHVARHSIKQVDGGWSWKFEQNPWHSPSFDPGLWRRIRDLLPDLALPRAFIRGACSDLCPPATELAWRRLVGPESPVVVIPAARHHVMLDQPLALVAALDALLSGFGRCTRIG